MLWLSKQLVVLAGVLWLVSSASCVLVQEPPHAMIHYIYDASLLWDTVTNGKMLPGIPHAINHERGVSERWKDFLRHHGTETMSKAVE